MTEKASIPDPAAGDDSQCKPHAKGVSPSDTEKQRTVDFAEGQLVSNAANEAQARALAENETLTPPTDEHVPSNAMGLGAMIAGRYTLLSKIGEGGMGEVWVAQQTEPVKRKVALKLIKEGMDSRGVLQRFEQERQALAMMDHPSIARVYDGGLTPSREPFFVMELVAGSPLTTFCDAEKLTPRERLELFVPICQAVQHAHQKGIVHRDLKPANILVTLIDGRPVPKVIDFGVAKATGGRLTEESMATQFGSVVGTLEYMSPEQAGMGGHDVDTRSDIYSLGIILYELLTGRRPIDAKRLKAAAIYDMIRVIVEEEPSKPSTRLSTDDALPSLAALRKTEPKKLMAMLRGELDWVVMKCLEKQRDRRYQTANGLSADVQRYLSGEAVLAAPPSNAYRFRKFVGRNRGVALAGASVAAALLIGAMGFAWQAHKAGMQRDLAIEAQRQEADQRRIADEQKTRALAAEAETRQRANELQKVAEFQKQMLADIDVTAAGIGLLQDIRARYDASLAKAGVPDDKRPAMVEAFADQMSRVNATDLSREFIDRTIFKPALAAVSKQFNDQPAIAATLRHVVANRYHDLGMSEAALAIETGVLAERRRILGDDHPDTLLSIGNTGAMLVSVGKYDNAEPYYLAALEKSRRILGNDARETLTCMANVGNILRIKGRYKDAEPYYNEALERRRRTLGDEHLETIESQRNCALLKMDLGKMNEAEAMLRDTVAKMQRAVGPDGPQTLRTANDLAVLLKQQGKLDESVALFRDVVARRRRLLGEVHPDTLNSVGNLGSLLGSVDQTVEAEALMRDALASKRRWLGNDHASTLVSLGNFSMFLFDSGKIAEGEAMAKETLERRRRVLGEDHHDTLVAANVMGYMLNRQKKFSEGEKYWRQTVASSRRTLGPTHPETLIYCQNLGKLLIDQRKPAEAEPLMREVVVEGGKAIGHAHPTVLSATRHWAGLLLEQKRNAEAADLLTKAEPHARKAYVRSAERSLGGFLILLGRSQARMGQFAAAEPIFLEANKSYLKFGGPANADYRGSTKLLVDFYQTWDKAEPNKGHAAQAAAWQAKLASQSDKTPKAAK